MVLLAGLKSLPFASECSELLDSSDVPVRARDTTRAGMFRGPDGLGECGRRIIVV